MFTWETRITRWPEHWGLQGAWHTLLSVTTNGKRDGNMANCVSKIVERHLEFKLAQIHSELRINLLNKPRICIYTLRNLLTGQLITLKNLETGSQGCEGVKMNGHLFAEWLFRYEEEIVYVDESGFHLQQEHVGELHAVRVVNNRRGTHFSIILALRNWRGLLHHAVHNQGTNQRLFNSFLEQVSMAADDRHLTYVTNNGSCHRRAVKAMVSGQHLVKYTPPHSSFLNICENGFSSWKAVLQHQLAEIRDQMLHQPQTWICNIDPVVWAELECFDRVEMCKMVPKDVCAHSPMFANGRHRSRPRLIFHSLNICVFQWNYIKWNEFAVIEYVFSYEN